MSKPILVDMDQILTNMLPYWLERYNDKTGENIKPSDVIEYEIRKFIKEPKIFDEILHVKGFFIDMEPINGAVEYFSRAIDDGHDIVVVTQAPRNSDYAVKEKKDWMKKYFPNYKTYNMIFCHRKELIRGKILFDDNPEHLIKWRANSPGGATMTIDYPYNRDVAVAWRFSQEEAWKKFYDFLFYFNKK